MQNVQPLPGEMVTINEPNQTEPKAASVSFRARSSASGMAQEIQAAGKLLPPFKQARGGQGLGPGGSTDRKLRTREPPAPPPSSEAESH